MYKYLIYGVTILILLIVIGCGATAPTKERNTALSAIEKAKLANAQKYSPNELQKSTKFFKEGEDLIDEANPGSPENSKAKSIYEDSLEYASIAYKNSAPKFMENLYQSNTAVLNNNDELKSAAENEEDYKKANDLYQEGNEFRKELENLEDASTSNFVNIISNYQQSIQILNQLFDETKKNKSSAEELLEVFARKIDKVKNEKLEKEIDMEGVRVKEVQMTNNVVNIYVTNNNNIKVEGNNIDNDSVGEVVEEVVVSNQNAIISEAEKNSANKVIFQGIKKEIFFVDYQKQLLKSQSDLGQGYYMKVTNDMNKYDLYLDTSINSALSNKQVSQEEKQQVDKLFQEAESYKVSAERGDNENYKEAIYTYKKANDNFQSNYYSKATPFFQEAKEKISPWIEITKSNQEKATKSMNTFKDLMKKLEKLKVPVAFPKKYGKLKKDSLEGEKQFSLGFYSSSNEKFLSLQKDALQLSDEVLLKKKEAEKEYNLSKEKVEEAKKKEVKF